MAKPKKPKASTILPPPERRLVLCVIGAPHGVRGQCRVKSYTEDPMAITDYGTLFSADGRVFDIDDGRWLKDDMLVVTFAGMSDRDVVAKLTGTELFVDRANLPEAEAEEFYHTDLIGLDIGEAGGPALGIVAAVHDFGAGDILEIRPSGGGAGSGSTWLLPFTKAAAPRVDLAARRIDIDPVFLTKPESARDKPAEEPGDGPDGGS